jgi:hypothetical protein
MNPFMVKTCCPATAPLEIVKVSSEFWCNDKQLQQTSIFMRPHNGQICNTFCSAYMVQHFYPREHEQLSYVQGLAFYPRARRAQWV